MRLLHVTLLLCAVMALTSAKCQPTCPDGWVILNDRCYKYVAQHMTWAAAKENCLEQCGNLVSINDPHENAFVKAFLPVNRDVGVWMGGTDRVKEGVWLWSDGTRVTYTGWAKGEPNNGWVWGHQNCMQMYGHFRGLLGKWDDVSCASSKPSVCVKPAWH